MSGDEVMCELYARTGIMVRWFDSPKVIGSIHNGPAPQGSSGFVTSIPVKIIAESSLEEFMAARKIANEIRGVDAGIPPPGYFYRVEAVD